MILKFVLPETVFAVVITFRKLKSLSIPIGVYKNLISFIYSHLKNTEHKTLLTILSKKSN